MPVAKLRRFFDRFTTTVIGTSWKSIRTYEIKQGEVWRIEALCVARQLDGSQRASFRRTWLVYRELGNVLFQPLSSRTTAKEETIECWRSHDAWDIRIILGASNVEFDVKNALNDSKWTFEITRIMVD